MTLATPTRSAASPCAGVAGRVRERLATHAWRERPVRAEFRRRDALKGRAVCRAERGFLPDAEVRLATISGGNADILNVLIFPHRPEAQPLLVLELFATAGVVRVAFLDLPYLGHDPARRESIRRATAAVRPNALEMHVAPEWARRHSTGEYLYARGVGAEGWPDLTAAILDGLDAWFGLREPTPAHADAATGVPLREFKEAHVTDSPNLGFLGSVFGAEWASRFMREFLYA